MARCYAVQPATHVCPVPARYACWVLLVNAYVQAMLPCLLSGKFLPPGACNTITHCCPRVHPAEDQDLKKQGYKPLASLYFMKQTISNACGTIGALHAIGNTLDKASLGA